jgi:uncharacterized protein YcaQ
MDGQGGRGWWDLKIAKRVASALWSSGELAVRERRNFQRTYDLTERVIPQSFIDRQVLESDAIEQLLLLALQGHGWATAGTLGQTWRLLNRRQQIQDALQRLEAQGQVVRCSLVTAGGGKSLGWIRPGDLDLLPKLKRLRPRPDRGVLLSPFDPLLWDRRRVKVLFGFDQVLEIFKPAEKRVYGYYCLPVLAGERLVARFDLKADRKRGRLHVLTCRLEKRQDSGRSQRSDSEAVRTAIERYAEALLLKTSLTD